MCTTFKHLNIEKSNFEFSVIKVLFTKPCFTRQTESVSLLMGTDAFTSGWLGKANK